MERRVLLAIFLAFLVLYAWQALFVKPVPKPTGANTGGPSSTVARPGDAGVAPTSSASPVPSPSATPEKSATVTAAAPPAAAPLVADTAEHDVRVDTRDV